MFLLPGADTVFALDEDVFFFSQRSNVQTTNEKEKVGCMRCVWYFPHKLNHLKWYNIDGDIHWAGL